ncbi:shikimate kinase [Ramlibacter sp. MAHUQ-53]|uniref:shikimate kinase n=1 Tax=unclassified Ramlibacter TaxID=2617605 RepID=UPI0036386065
MTTVALVGLPGSGKTTIGKLLARRLARPFVDSDHVIEDRLGCPIRVFWEQQGEEAFRDVEQAVIADLSAPGGEDKVLATGGGSVLREANRLQLRAGTHVIYLRTTPEQIYNRVRNDRKRPLLQVEDPMARLRALHGQRDPLYREAAHLTVDTGRPTLQTLVNIIVMQLELAGVLAKPA